VSVPAFDPLWLAALPGLVAVGIWALTDLQRFVLFAVMAAMIIPTTLAQPGGTQVALADVLLLVTLAAWVIGCSIRVIPGPWLAGNRMLLPALLFVAVNGASLMWSTSPRSTIVFTIQLIEIVVVFPLVFASLPRSIKDVRGGMFLFVACTCVLAVISAVSYAPRALSGSLEGQSFAGGLNKNVTGSFIAAGLIMAYTLWLGERQSVAKRLLALAAIIELAGLVSTVSRGSLIGTLVAVLAASLLLGRGRRVTLLLAGVVLMFYIATLGTGSQVDLSQSGSYDSSLVRHYSFANAVDKIQARPFLGTGGATYYDFIKQVGGGISDPNNMFLLTWAELGFAGLLALGFLLVRYVRILLAVRTLPDACAVPGVAAGCVTLSLFIHFQVDVTWTRGTSTLAFAMIGLMLAAVRLAPAHIGNLRRSTSSPRSPASHRHAPAVVA
jgi:hypothetical protein